MYQMNLFRRKLHRISDEMPFGSFTSIEVAGAHVAIVINKDGSLMATWEFRGPDLDSSVEEELAVLTNRLQGTVAALRTNYILWFESQRTPSLAYETTDHFPDIVTRGMDAERAQLYASGRYYESRFYATLQYLPPKDRQDRPL